MTGITCADSFNGSGGRSFAILACPGVGAAVSADDDLQAPIRRGEGRYGQGGEAGCDTAQGRAG